MEFATPSKRPSASTPSKAAEKPSSSPISIIKPSIKAAVAAAPPTGQIPTPKKPEQPPRQARKRKFAFSVMEVKKAAHGGLKKSGDRFGPTSSGNNLSSVEALLGAGAEISTKTSKSKNPVVLPEKYEALYEFFNCMESSIRLLRLRGSMLTFPNICNSIQHLTGRRFTYAHLAQMKHLLPEAILINKVLLHEETTCCMKPELQVCLDAEALTRSMSGKSESGFSISRKVFRERLVSFVKDHPEGEEVPKGELPHPFSSNHINQTLKTNLDVVKTSTAFIQPPNDAILEQKIMVPSHVPKLFQRRFTRKVPILDSEKTPLISLTQAPENEHSASPAASPVKCNSRPPIYKKSFITSPCSLATSRCETTEDTADFVKKENDFQEKVDMIECSPPNLFSTPLKLATTIQESQATSGLNEPIGCTTPTVESAKRSTRTWLFTTPTKRAKILDEEHGVRSSSDDDILNILPESLLQSIKEKEKKATENREAGVPEAIRRQRLIASLTTTFDMILLIFQSNKRSIMTKGELIHKLISSNLKVVDRGEVEEQLKIMQDLIPDWISEKTAYSGDILCCVNRISNPEEIRQRLQEAE